MKSTARATRIATLVRALRSATRPGSPSLADRGRALPRFTRAALSGTYPGARRTALLMLAAAAYIVSPVDALPEALLGPFGLLDDGFVIAWLAGTVLTSTEDFLAWEAGRTDVGTSTGSRVGPDGVPVITDLT